MKKDYWKGKTVLVTGGRGFIGSWLCRELGSRGARVISLDVQKGRPYLATEERNAYASVRFIHGDVRDAKKLRALFSAYPIHHVFHMAARAIVGETIADPAECLDSNIRGTWTLLETMRVLGKHAVPIAVASSDKAYGLQHTLPYTEELPLNGLGHPYDASKASADTIARMYASVYGLSVGVVRSGNVYGGGDANLSRLIPDSIKRLQRNKPVEIRSNGKLTRDYIYVEDAVHAYLLLSEALADKKIKSGEAFNIGCNTPLTVLQAVKTIGTLLGKSHLPPVILNIAKHEIENQFLDSRKAKKMLGWEPRYSFEAGLKKTIDWYGAHSEKHGQIS